jgi:hypothetical protein
MQYEVGQRLIANTHTKEYGILSVVFQIYCINIVAHFKIPPTVFYPQPKVDSILMGLHFVSPQQLQERLHGVKPSQLRRVITVTFQQRRKTIRNSIQSLLQELYGNNNTAQISTILTSLPLPLPLHIAEQLQLGTNPFYSDNSKKNKNSSSNKKTKKQQKASTKDDPSSSSITSESLLLLPNDWTMKRPEELTPAQFIELTRLIYSGCGDNTINDDDDDDDDNDNDSISKSSDISKNSTVTTSSTIFGNSKVWRKLRHGV